MISHGCACRRGVIGNSESRATDRDARLLKVARRLAVVGSPDSSYSETWAKFSMSMPRYWIAIVGPISDQTSYSLAPAILGSARCRE